METNDVANGGVHKPRVTQLKVNRDLLDPEFEGYKLAVESLPTKDLKLPGLVFV